MDLEAQADQEWVQEWVQEWAQEWVQEVRECLHEAWVLLEQQDQEGFSHLIVNQALKVSKLKR